VGLYDLIKILFELDTQPKFSGFVYLNVITSTNFKTSKMQPHVSIVHMIKNRFYSSSNFVSVVQI